MAASASIEHAFASKSEIISKEKVRRNKGVRNRKRANQNKIWSEEEDRELWKLRGKKRKLIAKKLKRSVNTIWRLSVLRKERV